MVVRSRMRHDRSVTPGLRKNHATPALLAALVVSCGADGRPSPPIFPPLGAYADAGVFADNRGVTPGQALVLFCHNIAGPDGYLDLTLEFGIPAITRITARGGSCTYPTDGAPAPCFAVPAGTYPGRLREGWTVYSQGTFQFIAGLKYFLSAHFEDKTGNVIPVSDRMYARSPCQGDDARSADGGTSR
jgi:hypothetical protein